MKVIHWTMKNGSGMHRMAESMAESERALGLNSFCEDSFGTGRPSGDIYVVHTHLADDLTNKGIPIIYVIHGTPEYIFQSSVQSGERVLYGSSNPFMMCDYWGRRADRVVTFWSRHAAIWQTILNRPLDIVPMGIDTGFWKPVPSRGKFAGDPSLFTAENPHYIKWPLDLFYLFPWLYDDFPGIRLHASYMVRDQQKYFVPLIQANGTYYRTVLGETKWEPEDLRNAFCSVDYYVGLVRYGDFNRICLEAKACGCKVISYAGNPYADFWITEGDQRTMARQFIDILSGKTKRLEAKPVPSLSEMAEAMKSIYDEVASGGYKRVVLENPTKAGLA